MQGFSEVSGKFVKCFKETEKNVFENTAVYM